MGVESDYCADFEPDPNAEPEELWEPVGASYYNGELILHRPSLSPSEHLVAIQSSCSGILFTAAGKTIRCRNAAIHGQRTASLQVE